MLGVGVGSSGTEFDFLAASFADRGARADDAIAALRAAWGTTRPDYDGAFYRFGSLQVEPCGIQPRVPIWVGGRTARSLRRALQFGDGWMPFALGRNEITTMLDGRRCPRTSRWCWPVPGSIRPGIRRGVPTSWWPYASLERPW
ncbi:MAG: LLM class flavin-dependent oxidoreductase [Mycobacterium sp.]